MIMKNSTVCPQHEKKYTARIEGTQSSVTRRFTISQTSFFRSSFVNILSQSKHFMRFLHAMLTQWSAAAR